YYRVNKGNIYVIALPGPLGADQETMDELTGLTYFPVSGGNADLTDIHSRLIAYLGDQEIKKRFLADTRYSSVVFLEEKDGYLTNLLSGFQYYINGSLEKDGPYVYYPIYNWGAGNTRNIVDVVTAVPEGYKIRRAVRDEGDLGRCRGSQVLEQYTGDGAVLTVPMGVTDIELKGDQGNGSVKIRTMILPESVNRIAFTSVSDCLPQLQAYEVTGSGSFQAIDGVLYSKDGKTLLSVPAGRTNIVIPETVTTIAGGAFRGSSIRELTIPRTVTSLEAGCFEDFQGEVIRMEGEGPWKVSADTGYHGKLLFADSVCDVGLKRGIFAFTSQNILFGAMDGNGAEIVEKTGLYCYDGGRDIVTLTKEPDTLAGIREDLSGYYAVPEGIAAIGGGAFSGAGQLREIRLPGTVKELREGSLRISDSVGEIWLSADMTEVSPKVFGDPAEGCKVPDVAVCVPREYYDAYV
ncbi:MAG: leucine-rich repeat domain-containing protein, partial [Lachnospiraceae bacterium]|nr:leucine-rich repeat domain-containing protein [Lachnospiraceae bacterium]